MIAILAVPGPMSDPGAILYRERPRIAQMAPTPSYPNWQRKRIQNPYSVSSNLTEGTLNRGSNVWAIPLARRVREAKNRL